MLHNVKNNAYATVTADTGGTITVDADNFPAAPFYLTGVSYAGSVCTIYEQLLEVTNKAGTVFTVARAVEGTQANLVGKTVELRVEAQHIQEIQAKVVTMRTQVLPQNNRTLDRAAIQAAFDANDEVHLASGTFLLSADGLSNPAQLLLWQKPGKLLGSGDGTHLVLTADVGANTDLLRVAPTQQIMGLEIGSFRMDAVSGTPGRHGIHFDLSNLHEGVTGGTPWIDGMIENGDFHHIGVHTWLGNCFGGYDFKLSNPNSDLTDGFYANRFRHIQCVNGMYFERLGDSVAFEHIRLLPGYTAGAHSGIKVASQTVGANFVLFYDVNGYGTGTMIDFNGVRAKLKDCNLEMNKNPNGDLAVVYIRGGWLTGKTELCTIEDCQAYALSGTNAQGIRIENADRTQLRGNRQTGDGGQSDLYVATSCTNTVITSPNIYGTNSKYVGDSSAIYIGSSGI